MPINNSTNFTTIATGSGSAVMATGTQTGFTVAGTGGISTSAAGSTITVTGSGSGTFVKQLRSSSNTGVASATVIPIDDTIPQNTEGDELITVTITPGNANNILLIEYVSWAGNGVNASSYALFQDSTANALVAVLVDEVPTGEATSVVLRYYMTAGTTSATTFKIRFGPSNTATVYDLQRATTGAAVFSTAKQRNFIVTEYTA